MAPSENPVFTERPSEAQRSRRTTAAAARLGQWALAEHATAPGWDQLVAEFKPHRARPGSYHARILEVRGEEETVREVLVLDVADDVVPVVEDLRAASYDPAAGAFLSAAVIVAASGWPEPEYAVGLDLNTDELPEIFADEPDPTAEDLAEDLRAYPRDPEAVPAWMAALTAESAAPAPEHAVPEPTDPELTDPEPAAPEPTDSEPSAAEARDDAAAPEPTAVPAPPAPSRKDPDVSADEQHQTPESGAPAAEAPVNDEVLRALRHYGRKPSRQTEVNVLRTLMGGELLLDTSGSEPVPGPSGEPFGPESVLRVQTVQGPDGATLLAVYARESTARAMHAATGNDAAFVPSRQRGTELLRDVLANPGIEGIVVEPNGEYSCRIGKDLIQWALDVPHHDAAKEALLAGDMQRLLGSLMTPEGQLLVALYPDTEHDDPVFATPEDGGRADTLMVFTSAPELAAVDPDLRIRSLTALGALYFATEVGAQKVSINALSPSAVLPIEQVQELLALADAQERL